MIYVLDTLYGSKYNVKLTKSNQKLKSLLKSFKESQYEKNTTYCFICRKTSAISNIK